MSRWGRAGLLVVLVMMLAAPLPASAEVTSPFEDEIIPFNAQPITLTGTVPYFLDGNAVGVFVIGEVGDFCLGTVVVADQWSCTLPLTVHLAPGMQTFEVMEEGNEPVETLRTVQIGPSALAITSAIFTTPTTLTVHGTRDRTGSSGVEYTVQAEIQLPFADGARVTVPCESVGDDGFTCTYEFGDPQDPDILTDVTVSEIWAEQIVETLDPYVVPFPGLVIEPVDPPSSDSQPADNASSRPAPAAGPVAQTPPTPSTIIPIPTVEPTPAAGAGEAPESSAPVAGPPVAETVDTDVLRLLVLAAIAFAILAMIGPHGLAYASDPVRRQITRGSHGRADGSQPAPETGGTTHGAAAALTLAGLATRGMSKERNDGTTLARRDGLRWGDRSWTWQLGGWKQLDRISRRTPMRLARRLPLIARIGADANYLRAMLGAAWLLLPVAGLLLGAVAANRSGGLPIAPATAITATLIVFAVLDATSGAVAVLVFTAVVLVRGGLTGDGLTGLDGIRGLLGLAALWFAIPLIAATARPFRRLAEPARVYRWDRLGDGVIAALVGGVAVYATVAGLGDLVGRPVGAAAHAGALGLLAAGAIMARVAIEEVIAIGYPARLRAVQPTAPLTEPSRGHRLRGIVVRGLIIALFASAAIGACWQLWAGVALYAVPQLLTLVEDRLPNLTELHRRLPRGVVEFLLMLVVGVLLARMIDATYHNEPTRALRDGFLLLALPGFFLATMGILGRDSPPPPWTWPRQLAGAVVVGLTIMLVVALA